MPFPVSTDWPTALDAPENRTDLVDIVWADDFDFQDMQIQSLQTWLGETGDLIGELAAAGQGPAGLASPVASGGVALTLAAKPAFAAGTILSVGDNFLAAYTEKMSLDHDGLLWSLGGMDAAAMLIIPGGVLGAAGIAGRLQWDTGTGSLNYDDGAAWNGVGGGGGAGSYPDFAIDYSYTEAPVPVEEVMGGGVFDGSLLASSSTAYFRVTIDPNISAGSVTVSLYDMGPKAGPLGVPRLVAVLPTGTNGLQVIEQALVVDPAPGPNEISDTARIYEVTITSAAVALDTAIVYSCGLDIRG